MLTSIRNWIARRPRRSGLGLVLVILVLAGSVWAIWIAQRAENLADELRSTGSSAESALSDADPDAIAAISSSLNSSMRSARQLDGDLWPLRWAGAVVGRVPVVGDNVTAVPDLVGRLIDDLEAAAALVSAADVLASVYSDLQNRDAGLLDSLSQLPPEGVITDASRLIDEAEMALARAEVTASGMDHGVLFGKLGRESDELGTQEVRLRELTEWSGRAAESLLALVRLADISLPLTGLLDGGDSPGAALDRDALSAMPELEAAADDAYSSLVSTNASAPPGIIGSQTGETLLDFEPLLKALADVAKAGGLTWTAITPALDAMESSQGGLIGEGTSILTALELLNDRQTEFQEARLILESVASELMSEKLNSSTAVAAGRTLSDASVELASAAGFLSDFPEIGTQALGTDGPRRYLVLGQTSDELRGSGGFVSGAWTISFDDGQMTDIEYHDVVEIDVGSSLELYPAPPELLAQHMDAPVWLLRDSMWSPEFPAAARSAAEIFELGKGGSQVDGVIALTQGAIVELVGALGTINTDRGDIGAEQLLPAIEAGTDAEGRAFVDTLFRGLLDELRSPDVNDRLFNLARAASDMLTRKDVLAYMSDPDLQDAIVRSGWDGSLGRAEGDRLAVIDSNIGWNKVDRNIERSFTYQVNLRPTGPMEGRIELSYRNTSADGRECDAQAPLHGLSYAELKESCYWNLLRVYVPDGAALVSNDPLPVPDMSVYVNAGAGLPGYDSVGVGIDSGGKFISGLLTVSPGESAKAGFDVSVPADAVISNGDMLTYRLSLAAQAGAIGRDALIVLELPAGYEYVGSSHEPTSVEETSVELALRLESDTFIEVMLQRTSTTTGGRFDAGSAEPRGVSSP